MRLDGLSAEVGLRLHLAEGGRRKVAAAETRVGTVPRVKVTCAPIQVSPEVGLGFIVNLLGSDYCHAFWFALSMCLWLGIGGVGWVGVGAFTGAYWVVHPGQSVQRMGAGDVKVTLQQRESAVAVDG